MGKGTLYTSKAQAYKSTGARLAWKYFDSLFPGSVLSIQFDFTCQEWIARIYISSISKCGNQSYTKTFYASKTEIVNIK